MQTSTSRLLPLALAMAGTLALAACDRDRDAGYGAEPERADVPGLPADPTPAPAMPDPAAPPVDSGMTYAEMDRNGDGGITRDELDAGEMLYQHFDVADTDGDGVLSQAEVDAHRAEMEMASGRVPPATE
jgi:hypothetical protein